MLTHDTGHLGVRRGENRGRGPAESADNAWVQWVIVHPRVGAVVVDGDGDSTMCLVVRPAKLVDALMINPVGAADALRCAESTGAAARVVVSPPDVVWVGRDRPEVVDVGGAVRAVETEVHRALMDGCAECGNICARSRNASAVGSIEGLKVQGDWSRLSSAA